MQSVQENLLAAGRTELHILTKKHTILKCCSEFFMGRELTRHHSAYRLTKKLLPGFNDMLLLSLKQYNASQNKTLAVYPQNIILSTRN